MSTAEKLEISVTPGTWFRQDLLFPVFGLSTEAVRKYRSRGIWLEGKHWRWDPAHVIVYNRDEIEKWMAGQP
ncbi:MULTISPECIES: excisionase family protein [Pseudomonas]|uniref:excisionase family protein n=1 Tax=Pseudomonas TaxID=286 RepID=UPI0008E1C88D|nr:MULTISPECIES: excisionase family protein [Pseudomonas]SFU95484.1 Putative excisionase [Pseudomonas sp. OV546]